MADRVLLIKGISGLGDRILCLLTGVLYARLAGRRLVIDWCDEAYASAGVNAFHHFFLSPLCPPHSAVPDTDSVTPSVWRGWLGESAAALRQRHGSMDDPEGWRAFSVDLRRLDLPERVAVLWTYGAQLAPLRPHLPSPVAAGDDAAILRPLMHELSLRPHIRERVDRFRREHFHGRTIGVHVRYTDHRTALLATLRALHRVLREDPSCRIFLCTDNVRVAELFRNKYGSVLATDHWYAPVPGRVLHYGAGRPDPLAMGEEALVDLYLLSACDDLIVDTSSSFAYVATLLAAASARVVDVKRGDKLHPRLRHASNSVMRRFNMYAWAPALAGMLAGPLRSRQQPDRRARDE